MHGLVGCKGSQTSYSTHLVGIHWLEIKEVLEVMARIFFIAHSAVRSLTPQNTTQILFPWQYSDSHIKQCCSTIVDRYIHVLVNIGELVWLSHDQWIEPERFISPECQVSVIADKIFLKGKDICL